MDTYIQELVEKNKGSDVRKLMEHAKSTKKSRIIEAFENASNDEAEWTEGRFPLLRYYAMLALRKNIDVANEQLFSAITSEDQEVISRLQLKDKWSLWLNTMFIRMYMYFGTPGSGVLSKQNEELILNILWEFLLKKNDIHLASKSTWHLTGSENHDLNFKVCALLTSQIFKSLPDYKDRIYPDMGKGAGSGYWFPRYGLMCADKNNSIPEGRGDDTDGRAYTAREHYDAWCVFLKEYFRERARRGFFLEAGATGYMKWTLSFIGMIIEFAEDKELVDIVRRFYDLIWCEWAQEQIYGRRGGAKTRYVFEDWQMENDSMYYMAKFWLGGSCDAMRTYYFQLHLDYDLPEIVWDMVINRHKMGSYEYISRRPGEEEMVFPRPYGYERTLRCASVSRMVHYSYITADYILGTQFDHPYMIHSHLSCASRWNGLILAASPDSYIFPAGFENTNGSMRPVGKMYKSVQYKNVLICALNTHFFSISPEWFPKCDNSSSKYGFYLGKKFETQKMGSWLIIKDSGSYIGLRPAYGTMSLQGERILMFSDPMSPAIMHVESRERFDSEKSFYNYLEHECKLKVNDTVVSGYYTIDYTFDDIHLYFNAANSEPPRICGKLIDYEYPYTYKSPFISSEYGSGKIIVSKDDRTMEFDFN